MNLSISEVAIKSNHSQKTIRRHIAAGKLQSKKINNKYIITQENFNSWIKSDKSIDDKGIFKDEIILNNLTSDNINWIDISSEWLSDGWNNLEYRNQFNFVDLFAGAGGLSCGLTMAGFTPVASVEIMPEAVETYSYNFIKRKGFKESVESRDIREQKTKNSVYDSVKDIEVDLIAGGFPCQGFSMSGNRVITDERNSLYLEMLKIVNTIKPKFIVMENVTGLRSMLDGNVESKIISDYKEIGYEINVTTLNSADYFTPQIRKRVIFIGNRVGAVNYHPKPLLNPKDYITLGECIKKYMVIPEDKTINHIITRHSLEMQNRLANVPEGSSLYPNYSDSWKKSPWDKPSCTIKENHGAVNIHPKLPRVLTPREIAALQSFPDDFIFKGSKKWQLVQIGNAVPPLLGKSIGIAVMKSIQQAQKNL